MYACVSVCGYVYGGTGAQGGTGPSEMELAGSCELPGVDAEDQTWVPARAVCALSHRAMYPAPRFHFFYEYNVYAA